MKFIGLVWFIGLTIGEVGKLVCIYKEAVAFHFYLYPIHIRAVGVKVYKCDFVDANQLTNLTNR